MSRHAQPSAAKGSLRWIQAVVNDRPELIDEPLRGTMGLDQGETIEWLSPVRSDEYAEYRDSDALQLLRAELPKRSLSSFWPVRGPQWDALARASRGDLLLVEAKAHIADWQVPERKRREPGHSS